MPVGQREPGHLSKANEEERYDLKSVSRAFQPGDQVLVLIPLIGSALQARYSGPYCIERRVNDLNYILSTPDRRRKTTLCDINRLKSYSDHVKISAAQELDSPRCVEVSGDEIVALSTSRGAEVAASLVVASPLEDEGRVPSAEVVEGRMKNSQVLSDLKSFLSGLTESQGDDLCSLFEEYKDLFPDVPRQTTAAVHDIDVGSSNPIKQHPYRTNPQKRVLLQEEVKFMQEHGIAEASCSPWSLPCLLVPKSDGSCVFVPISER